MKINQLIAKCTAMLSVFSLVILSFNIALGQPAAQNKPEGNYNHNLTDRKSVV